MNQHEYPEMNASDMHYFNQIQLGWKNKKYTLFETICRRLPSTGNLIISGIWIFGGSQGKGFLIFWKGRNIYLIPVLWYLTWLHLLHQRLEVEEESGPKCYAVHFWILYLLKDRTFKNWTFSLLLDTLRMVVNTIWNYIHGNVSDCQCLRKCNFFLTQAGHWIHLLVLKNITNVWKETTHYIPSCSFCSQFFISRRKSWDYTLWKFWKFWDSTVLMIMWSKWVRYLTLGAFA